MPAKQHIRYLKQKEIDRVRWDDGISRSSNGLVYAYSSYLDHMASHWDALVLNEYEALMPLPWRKKFGIHYLYQPYLTAQLGLFGNQITAGLLKNFLDAIPSKFRLWEFSLNQANVFEVPGYHVYERKNFVLDLNQNYDVLHAAYRENIRRNIKKSAQYGCTVATDLDMDSILPLVKLQNKTARENELQSFSALYRQFKQDGRAKTYGIVSKQAELLASAVFLFSHQRAYYILVGNHPNGRTLGASHALIDAFIKDHAEHNLVLDFEGSDLRNLAFFYSSFGAREETYAAIRHNRLPWYIRFLKK